MTDPWTNEQPSAPGRYWRLVLEDDPIEQPVLFTVTKHPTYDYLVAKAPKCRRGLPVSLDLCYGGEHPSIRTLWTRDDKLPKEPKLQSTGTIELVNALPTESGRYWFFTDTPGDGAILALAVASADSRKSCKGCMWCETLSTQSGWGWSPSWGPRDIDPYAYTWWARVPLYGPYPEPVINGKRPSFPKTWADQLKRYPKAGYK